MENKVCSIIVLYNPREDLFIKQHNSLKSEVDLIIYIDNNSNNYDSIVSCLNKEDSKFLIYKNNENKGLAYAQNQGIKIAKDNNFEYILFLDHDSIIEKGYINKMLYLLNSDKKIGAVGPVYIDVKTNEIYPITKYIGPFIKRIIPDKTPIEATFLISSGSVVPIKILDEVGYMEEKLFIDYIDVEWSLRVKYFGYKLIANPKTIMKHSIGDKRKKIFGRFISLHSPERRYYLIRNSIFMLKCSYIPLGYKVREFFLNILRIIFFSLVSNEKIKYLKFSIKGLKDGLNNSFGKLNQ